MSKTSLYDQHVQQEALMVEFSGWSMPMHYGSQVEEHRAVRQRVGLFDVSHMAQVDVMGEDSLPFLRLLLANDVAKLKVLGKALYTCLLNPQGGITDDLIVYYFAEDHYRVILNAGCFKKDMAWLQDHASDFSSLQLTVRDDLSLIALQGPQVMSVLSQVVDQHIFEQLSSLKPFYSLLESDTCYAHTGYTGELGFEIMLPHAQAVTFWQACLKVGVQPCGLGARDTLRLEAGLNLYGQDMTESTSPWESNLGWTVCLKDETRDFIGKTALLKQKKQGVTQQLVGVVMRERGMLRNQQPIAFVGNGQGYVTSGSFSPTLNCSIALARIPVDVMTGASIMRRGQSIQVDIVKPPFVRQGQLCIDLND